MQQAFEYDVYYKCFCKLKKEWVKATVESVTQWMKSWNFVYIIHSNHEEAESVGH